MIIIVTLILAVAFALYISPKEEMPKGAIQHMKDRGQLVAVLEPNTLNYFIYRGEAFGFGLSLLQEFSLYLDIPLKVIACSTASQAYYYLDYHVADIMAYNLPVTRQGKNLAQFSSPLLETNLVFVQHTPIVVPSLDELKEDTVVVQKNIFFQPLYDRFLSKTGSNVYLKEVSATFEELFQMVSTDSIRHTLCPENLAIVLSQVYLNTDISLPATRNYPVAWALNHSSDSLREIIDYWLDSIANNRLLPKTFREIYHNPRIVNHFRSDYFSLISHRISPWDEQLQHYSKLFWWDWRLVASLMYSESNFIPNLTSHKNAYGLMQMIPETAEIYGLDTASNISQQIMAGVKYLKWIDRQLPPDIKDPRERASFILAAYNLGIGRVLSLRKKAEAYGKDPNVWHGNVEYYLLRRSGSDPYGYADTLKEFPVNYSMDGYVDGILNRYYHYLNLLPD
ncbi:MAG: transglycosylase SLT domain-containing protein [Bacteroidales bacterium]|nr:transglycosylase SLT domain-containing protein [Bacteroidales bacterium]